MQLVSDHSKIKIIFCAHRYKITGGENFLVWVNKFIPTPVKREGINKIL